ncbi:SDR family oxidoreductase [Sphingomonas profundi]|uniref:SDR family oxidoreductase n=1 Tax=Alterirhizorhabdus profundi TaxID=2681549 RepID=UPI0012E76099|nr:SDR family oxidoreductase [Sphingomonas profundi]
MTLTDGRRSIFITGAASGIGRATAVLFGQEGWFVGGFDVNGASLDGLKRALGEDNCIVGVLDVTDPGQYAKSLDTFAAATDGRLDLLFNNAGIGRRDPFAAQPLEAAVQMVQVNLVGVLNGIHLALPLLRATPNSLCFTTSSSSATYGMPGIAVYSATKHAVKGLTEALSIEFREFGVRAADVLPGLINTPIIGDTVQSAPAEGAFRLLEPIEVAKAVLAAYGSDRLHWYVPEELAEIDRLVGESAEAAREEVVRMIEFSRTSVELSSSS